LQLIGGHHNHGSPSSGDLNMLDDDEDRKDGLRSPSPLLDTAILPSGTDSCCPYCNKPFRKVSWALELFSKN
jgi:hypothetical protein